MKGEDYLLQSELQEISRKLLYYTQPILYSDQQHEFIFKKQILLQKRLVFSFLLLVRIHNI